MQRPAAQLSARPLGGEGPTAIVQQPVAQFGGSPGHRVSGCRGTRGPQRPRRRPRSIPRHRRIHHRLTSDQDEFVLVRDRDYGADDVLKLGARHGCVGAPSRSPVPRTDASSAAAVPRSIHRGGSRGSPSMVVPAASPTPLRTAAAFPPDASPPLQVLVRNPEKTGVRVDLLDDQPCHLEASAVDMRMSFSDDGVWQRVPPLAARAVGPLPVVLDSGRFMRFVGDVDHGPVLDGPSFSASIRGFVLTIPHSIPRPVSEAPPARIAALRPRDGVPARAVIVISPTPRSSS